MGCCSSRYYESESCCDDSCESSESTHKCHTQICRPSCFGTCSGLNFLCVAFLSFILFLTATGLVAYYVTEYHQKNFKYREYNTTEDKEMSMNAHAVLTTFGFITLAGIGITMYRISSCCERASLRVLHIFIQIAAAVAIYFGVYIPYEINKIQKRPHFYSTHSWAGLVAIGLFALVMACGILKFILLLMCGPVSCCLRASCIPIHAGLGLAAYWTAIVAIVNAMQRDLVEANIKRKKYKGFELGLWWGDTLSDFIDVKRTDDGDEERYRNIPKIEFHYRRPIFFEPNRPRQRYPLPRFTPLPPYVPDIADDGFKPKKFPSHRFTLLPPYVPDREDEYTQRQFPQPHYTIPVQFPRLDDEEPTIKPPYEKETTDTSEVETTTLPSPPRLPGKDPVYPGASYPETDVLLRTADEESFSVDRVHLAGGLCFLLVCCGLLVTYSVLSRFWGRRIC